MSCAIKQPLTLPWGTVCSLGRDWMGFDLQEIQQIFAGGTRWAGRCDRTKALYDG
jgi:hypothetical protein